MNIHESRVKNSFLYHNEINSKCVESQDKHNF